MNLYFDQEVKMEVDNEVLDGILAIPPDAKGIVIFSHGSGSGRFSPRNKLVAERLHQEQIGTLLLDLLTPSEDRIYTNRFDIALLAHRLVGLLPGAHRPGWRILRRTQPELFEGRGCVGDDA